MSFHLPIIYCRMTGLPLRWINLNVGGTKFATTVDTINAYPDSMLAKLCATDSPFGKLVDEKGAILIDRDPVYFRAVLNFLRTGKLLIDSGISIEGIIEEAAFFHIPAIIDLCKSKVSDFNRRDFFTKRKLFAESGLEGVSLHFLDLSNVPLPQICFDNSKISNCLFVGCNLVGSSFCLAVIENCTFDNAVMTKAAFNTATLINCTLDSANMENSIFSKAIAPNTSFRNTRVNNSVFQLCNLEGADFTNSVIGNAKFQGANLRRAIFKGVKLNIAHFRQADLRSVEDFNWNEAEFVDESKITQVQHDALPEAKKSMRFLVLADFSELELSNLFQVKGTTHSDGTGQGVNVYDYLGGNTIGCLYEHTKVLCQDEDKIEKFKGIWFRYCEPLPDEEQDNPPHENEIRRAGWVAAIYLQRLQK